MKRTTISLPEDLAWRLEREAKRHEVSASEVVRRVLAEHFDMVPDRPRHVPWAALGRSGYTDTAARLEEILAEEWEKDIDWRR